MILQRILLLIFLSTSIFANSLKIDEKTTFKELLSHSQILIDKTNKLSFEDIKTKEYSFEKNNKNHLGFGYSPNFTVWVKFKLENTSNKTIYKTLEYANALTTDIYFYDLDKNYKAQVEGLANISDKRKSINPTFKIRLEANETKTYYLKASSYITTLIIKLNIWETDSFFEEELLHQIIIALFFGAMSILALYNLFIYFYTKDNSYLFYVLYMVSIMIHHLFYIGVVNVYLIPSEYVMSFIQYATIIVGIPAFALALFTKYFLQTNQYYFINKILNTYLVLFPFLISIFLITDDFNKYRNIFSVLLLVFLVFITAYASYKRNRQAYFLLFGWMVFLSSGLCMYLSSVGVFNIFGSFPYFIETALVIEALVFSIALADRIKQLQKDKEEANHKLIVHQQNEKIRLQEKVDEKTYDLKIALDEKGLLLKELNHRVKNNMQTIVSLIRLQGDDIKDEKLKDVLTTIQNRISAMGHLHELLYMQENVVEVDAKKYFNLLISEAQNSYEDDVKINLQVLTNLKMGQAIYCGLILNELISNAFKHAFEDINKAKIEIRLEKNGDYFTLKVEDNGVGFTKEKQSNSLGLILVETLAKDQLKGDLQINTSEGVKVGIIWSANE